MRTSVIDTILENTYRKKESRKKIFFILRTTHITLSIITKASSLIKRNEYHNFDHILGATEMGIKIAQAEGYTKQECTEIAFALLVHDAGHQGFMTSEDEKRSVVILSKSFSVGDFESMNLNKVSSLKRLEFKILATVFKNRGMSKNPDAHIMQDADLAHIGQGPYYWLWSSMGLIDEFNKLRKVPLRPVDFIKTEQRSLIYYLQNCSEQKSIWLSEGAQEVLIDPRDDIDTIESWSTEAIEYAYATRHTDLLVSEFKTEIKHLNTRYKKKVA